MDSIFVNQLILDYIPFKKICREILGSFVIVSNKFRLVLVYTFSPKFFQLNRLQI